MPSANTAMSPSHAARLAARTQKLRTSTSGLAATIQCNLLVLPSKYANDFRQLCLRNPVPCPLLDVLPPGHFSSRLASDNDLRTDIPAYNIFKDGKLIHGGVTDITEEWSDDHVGFLIGCSYSFETALAKAGLAPRHMKGHRSVPMFTTNVPLNPAGVFTGGRMVVSMRSYKPHQIEKVREISRRFATQHGEPIAWGWEGAERLGLLKKMFNKRVDFGDWVDLGEDEVPVFWGCGVTPQVAVMESGIKGIVMSHKPGCMFVTDIPEDDTNIDWVR